MSMSAKISLSAGIAAGFLVLGFLFHPGGQPFGTSSDLVMTAAGGVSLFSLALATSGRKTRP